MYTVWHKERKLQLSCEFNLEDGTDEVRDKHNERVNRPDGERKMGEGWGSWMKRKGDGGQKGEK